MNRLIKLVLCTVLCCYGSLFAQVAPCLQNGNARVIFVGDSITGQSRNARGGYANQFEAAVKAVYPDCNPQIISLGGSGHSVRSWTGVEKKSRDRKVILDIKKNDVHEVLAKHADVLVIMLGMNDVLAPYVGDTTESIDKWEQVYQQLIDSLKTRVTPTVLALASTTPCTEDPLSPKNQLIDKMNLRVKELAAKNHARYLPTSETVWSIQRFGRSMDTNFHVTVDYVHPTTAGHIGIAMGMLQGLGETRVANWLKENPLQDVYKHIASRKQPFAWEIHPSFDTDNLNKVTYTINYHWLNPTGSKAASPNVTLTVPNNWQATASSDNTASGHFTVTGTPDHLLNRLTLKADVDGKTQSADIQLPAPWLVGYSFVQRLWKQPGYQFMADKAQTPVDDVIEVGGEFTKPIDMGKGKMLTWKPYSPSINFTGGNNPNSVDFAAMLHAGNFEAGYITRWVYSDKDRTCSITPKSRMFAGVMYVKIWVNGNAVFEGRKRKAPSTDIQLKKGWNTLVCRSSHHNWQWQLSLPITGKNGDDLSDLRYSIVPMHN